MSEDLKPPAQHEPEQDRPVSTRDGEGDGNGRLGEQLDPAQRSLADALRVSFNILKVVMLILVVVYLLSGFFMVGPNQEAVRLRLGHIVGGQGGRVYKSDWGMALPYPFERVVKVSTAPRQVAIRQAFWSEQEDQNGPPGVEQPASPLNPLQDGFLLTADANIVQGRFSVTYHIEDTAAFLRQVGLTRLEETLTGGRSAAHEMARADRLVRGVAEQGILYAVAQTTAARFYAGQPISDRAALRAQQLLENLNAGLVIDQINVTQRAVPAAVSDAFQAVSQAQSQRAQNIESAQQDRARILGEAAGEGYQPLRELIQAYNVAQTAGEQDLAGVLMDRINQALSALRISPAVSRAMETYQNALNEGDPAAAREQLLTNLRQVRDQPAPADAASAQSGGTSLGGDVAGVIQEGQTYRSSIQQTLEAELSRFHALLDAYRRNPQLVLSRLREDARQAILTSEGVETFYSTGGRFYPVLNRDPAVQRQRQRQALQQQDETEQNNESNPSGGTSPPTMP